METKDIGNGRHPVPNGGRGPAPSEYQEWTEAITALVHAGGLVFLLGDTDTGKTTFATLLANEAVSAGKKVAVVDADIGQSEIGPPGCVGAGFVDERIESLSQIHATDIAFVGSTSPRGRFLEHAAAVGKLVDHVRSQDPGIIILDTTGFVRGAPACRFKSAKIDLVEPRHIVAIQRRDECEPILQIAGKRAGVQIHRLPVPQAIARKPPAFRAQRRVAHFGRYLSPAERLLIPWDQAAFAGTWLTGIGSLPPHQLRFLTETLGVTVYYAENRTRFLGIVAAGPVTRPDGMAIVDEQLKPDSITITRASCYKNLYVGLIDCHGKTLATGLIERIDFARKEITLLAPLRVAAPVAVIHFGAIRIRPDGAELGALRSGEI